MSVRLYVGNLPEEVDRQALEELFTSAGEVISTKVIRDRKTGKCRGFGFVTVNTQEQAEQYIEKFNGHSFGDANLRIEIAQPRDKGEETDSSAASAAHEAKESGEKSGESRAPSKKQRNRGGKGGSGASATAEVGSASGPDPRWASQLQRIKEQLLQATNS
ncbi:RNA recognition motif domain-containing protein [Thermostichus vulcanus]|uniref:RNA-binding protein n=1 Tax=Thermostichus vulcanus str. 'Rupite' TaxID=2813851 RepID=A0ABT0C6S2_THEVL|nr:RNA-binding protein [Thermostichus vulcanus]MCJ2541471.1 RNA-binding protein [Thermostichus vulcanus str. 'Rupite']